MGSLEVQQDLIWVFGNGIWSGVYVCPEMETVCVHSRQWGRRLRSGRSRVGRVATAFVLVLLPRVLSSQGAQDQGGRFLGNGSLERLRRSCGHELAGAKSRGHSLRTSLNVPHNMFPPPEITISRDPVGLFGLSPNHRTPCGRCRVPRQRSYVANQ